MSNEQVDAAVALERRLRDLENAVANHVDLLDAVRTGVEAVRAEVKGMRIDNDAAHNAVMRRMEALATAQAGILAHMDETSAQLMDHGERLAVTESWRLAQAPVITAAAVALPKFSELQAWFEQYRKTELEASIIRRWWARGARNVWKSGLAVLGAGTALVGFVAGAWSLWEVLQ